MLKYRWIVTSSKLLLTKGFHTKKEAEQQAKIWDSIAPVGQNDCEVSASLYSWDDWVRIAVENEFNPFNVSDS